MFYDQLLLRNNTDTPQHKGNMQTRQIPINIYITAEFRPLIDFLQRETRVREDRSFSAKTRELWLKLAMEYGFNNTDLEKAQSEFDKWGDEHGEGAE